MIRPLLVSALVAVLGLAVPGRPAAHITPPVVLVSDRDALVALLAGAQRFFVREVRLSADERRAVAQQTGWTPDEDFYRFYVGRDAQGRLVAATVFLTEFTIHGPVRAAIALGPDGKLRGLTVVEVTEETYPWVKTALDRDVTRDWIGQDAGGAFPVAPATLDAMPAFYTRILATLARRAATLFTVTRLPT